MTTFHDRREYIFGELSESSVERDPLHQFHHWMREAIESKTIDEPYAMTLATVGRGGKPSSRVVLLREANEEGFTFFTNYDSRKGQDVASNTAVAALFYWGPLERQIRIEGDVERVDDDVSDRYFASRPFQSRLSAIASQQSTVIKSRVELEHAVAMLHERYSEGSAVPRPPNWGGLRIVPNYYEFWQGRQNRLHDRISYHLIEQHWQIARLSP